MDLFEYADTQQEPLARYEELCRIVNRNNELYYAKAQPEISDAEYDRLFRELEELEAAHPELISPDSPTRRVGNDLVDGFAKVTHPEPMLSIDDIFEKKPGNGETDAELIDFYNRLGKALGMDSPPVVVEPKIDGCAVTLMYREGKLVYAATRGDGRTGDDITANVRTIRTLPTVLPPDAPAVLEVRGEIYMPSADFDALNEQRDADGLSAFANPRNATAGTIKLLNPAEVAQRPLRFLAHGLGLYEGAPLLCAADFTGLLKRMGIPANEPIIYAGNLDELRRAVVKINTLRRELGYGTDGAVIKLDSFALREQLGATSRAPRWAAAFKYLPEQKETELLGITVQVGRSGVLTPVAELRPVPLSGTVVSRATLHNQDEISRKDVRIGDTVLVEKAGEIIPSIVHVVKDKRKPDAQPYTLYDAVHGVCPGCGAPISQEEGQVAWRCTNFTCPSQAAMRTTYFCKREALDVESLGGVVAEALVNRGMIKSPLDLFLLRQEELAALNLGSDDEPRRLGEKNAAKALDTLEKAKKLPLERWLTAFGIPSIGTVKAQDVATFHRDLEDLAHSSYLDALLELEDEVSAFNALPKSERDAQGSELLEKAAPWQKRGYLKITAASDSAKKTEINTKNNMRLVNPLGSVSTRKLRDYLASAAGRHTLEFLRGQGINPVSSCYREDMAESESQGALSGLTFVLTGTLSRPRSEVEKLIRAAGGSPTGAISKSTSYLVAGEGGGSKREKAAKLGIPVIDEAALLRMMEGGEP